MQSIIDEDGNLNGDRMLLLMVCFSGDGTADGISGLVCMPFSAHYDISRAIQISIVRIIVLSRSSFRHFLCIERARVQMVQQIRFKS